MEQPDLYTILPDPKIDGLCMILKGEWHEKYHRIIKEKNVTSLRLSRSAGWRSADVTFLKDLDCLRGIEIYSANCKDISPIWALKSSQHIGLDCNLSKAGDFSEFTQLRTCFLRWQTKAASALSATCLEELNVVNYPHDDFSQLCKLNLLKNLKITSRKLQSLKGVQDLPRLNSLDLFQCNGITCLKPLREASSLQTLNLDGCKSLNDLTPLKHLGSLETLSINDCGSILSLEPLIHLEQLKHVYFAGSTIVENGSLSALMQLSNLQSISFANRKHYDMSRTEITEALACRRG
ncbi:MAG: hypothetical protein AB8B97_10190 [Granulosicoccus sp.]